MPNFPPKVYTSLYFHHQVKGCLLFWSLGQKNVCQSVRWKLTSQYYFTWVWTSILIFNTIIISCLLIICSCLFFCQIFGHLISYFKSLLYIRDIRSLSVMYVAKFFHGLEISFGFVYGDFWPCKILYFCIVTFINL